MARIAFIQNKLGRTDGVSLEVDKWRRVLEARGHQVYYIAGNDEVAGNIVIPELLLDHPDTHRILRNATVAFSDYANPAELMADIEGVAQRIEGQLREILRREAIDLIIPNNLLSVGYNVPAIPALARVIEDGMPAIVHSHDFWFEDSGETNATCAEVEALFSRLAPPDLPNIRHVCINSIAQKALASRRGIQAQVVPNVFDFDQPSWQVDEWNATFRADCGLEADDIVILQATRVLDRKGVELAIDVAARLNQPPHRDALRQRGLYDGRRGDGRIVLLCAGYIERFGITGDYVARLTERASGQGVDLRFVGDRVGHSRGQLADGGKRYSLWDVYAHADLVSYPSYWEGWGNQFIEAVFARLPVLLFEYPVWTADLAQAGFHVVSLGDSFERGADGLIAVSEERLQTAAAQCVDVLCDAQQRTAWGQHNAAIAAEHYSLTALDRMVADLLQRSAINS